MSIYQRGVRYSIPGCLLTAVLVAGVEPAFAQHQGHGGPQFGVSAEAAGIVAKTTPADDAVLMAAPSAVGLEFPKPVNLVKLVVYSDTWDWVDIDFRYDPTLETGFSWAIPALTEAPYYSVNWAILDEEERLIKGSFNFAFGPDAEPPSVVMEREMMRMNHQSTPVRDQMPVAPGGIRFNNDPEPAFEPPFAPVLGQPR